MQSALMGKRAAVPLPFCKEPRGGRKFLFLLLLLAAAFPGRAQSVTLSVKEAPLEVVLQQIGAQTSHQLVYAQETIQKGRPVTVSLHKVSLKTALAKVFKNQPLAYSIEEGHIIIKAKEEKNLGPAVTDVTGRVSDEAGAPLAGATVQVQGSSIATATNSSGQFRLRDVGPDAVLLISSIGYRSRTEALNGRREVQVQLALAVSTLDETVVIAYGTTSRRLNTGNIGKVAAEEIAKQPVSNPLAALQSRIPGLDIVQSSGVPGSSFKVLLRGQNSLVQGTEPLIVIDGVPLSSGNARLNRITVAADLSPLSTINPADIESIEVLKDADATSIYGSRGANGVILITTKKGSFGKTRFDAHVTHSFGKVTRTMDMLHTQQYLAMRREAFANDGMTPSASTAPDLLLWDTTTYQDFKKLLIGGTAHVSDAQISLSGGSGSTRFSLGAGYLRESTVYPGDLYSRRASVRLGLQHQTQDKKLSLQLSTLYSATKSNLLATDLTNYINLPPHLHLYDGNGNLKWSQGGASFQSLGLTNPLSILEKKYAGQFDNLVTNLRVDYQVLPSLSLKASVGYNTLDGDETLINPGSAFDPALGQKPFSTFGYSRQKSWIAEPQLQWVKKFGKSRFEFLAGGTWQENMNKANNTAGLDYSSDLLLSSIEGAGRTLITHEYSRYRYQGLFGRLNYQLKDQYILNLSGRRDGSSKFGPASRFNNFGAVGAAWVFSKYEWMKQRLPFLSFGKIRGSYGVAGNDQIANYLYLDTWVVDPTTYLGGTGLLPSRLYNPYLAWERNRKMEVGAELGFFGDRLLLSTAYYRNRSDNQLISYSLPLQTGFASISRNFDALLQNQGWEVSLQTQNIRMKEVEWSSAFHFTRSRNKLLKFPGLSTSPYATTYVLGEPVTTQKLYRYLGVDQGSGIYQFEDVDHNGVFNAADRTVLKSMDPSFFGGVQNTLVYKGFEADLFFEFKKQRGRNYLYTQGFNVPGYGLINQPQVVMGRWQQPGGGSAIQRFTADASSAAYASASRNLVESDATFSDASYVRCKNISLSYRMSGSKVHKSGIESLRFYVQARNLFSLTSYQGADPENQNLYVLPPLKAVTLGVHLQF